MKQGGEHSSGFTIVETMIVLAVSTALAAGALAFINGRQNATQFQTGINDLQQQIQQIINETVSGYYPNKQDFLCGNGISGAPPTISNSTISTTHDQGTNDECIMVGKALLFQPKFTSNDRYLVYTLAGHRSLPNGNDVRDQTEAQAVAIAPTTSLPNSAYANDSITESKRYENSITYQWASYVSDASYYTANPTPGNPPQQTLFAIASSFADYSGSGLKSQGQNYQLIGVNGISSATGWTTQSDSQAIAQTIYTNNGLAVDGRDDGPFKQVKLCFASGTTTQSGLISIGDENAAGLGLTLQIYDDLDCGR